MKKLFRITTVPLSLDKLLGEQLRFMSSFYAVTAISADEKELRRVAAKYGVRHKAVEMTRQITLLKDLAAVHQLYRYLKREQPFIVHTHTPKAGIVGMLAAKLARIPHRLHTVAGLPLMESRGLKKQILKSVEKLTYACATKIYPNSRGLQQYLTQQNFCAADKLKVLGQGSSNGIDTTFFDPALFSADDKKKLRAALNLETGDFVFVFVGRLVGDKGINELVAAFQELSDSGIRLLLVGPEETALDPLAPETRETLRRNPRIVCTGWQEDVRPYLAAADALVFPSYREGFPNVVLQAGAMGLPAIVTDINGCNEIITDGENGLVIPVKNRTALRDAMIRLRTDTRLYAACQQKARPLICARYEQHAVWEALLQEYRRLT